MNTYSVGTAQPVGAALWPRMLMFALLISFGPLAANQSAKEQATAALEAGQAEQAIEILERAIRTDRNNAELHFLLGNAEAAHIGNRNALGQMRAAGRMRRAWERAVELDPSHLQARFSLMSYYAQAPGIAGGDKAKARAEAAEIARRDVVMGHRAAASLAAMDSDFPGAVAELQQAVAKTPDDAETRAPLLGELGFMCQRAEDWACAHEAFTAAVADDEKLWMAWYQIGRTAVMSGQHLEAGAAALERYLGHTPVRNEPSLAWANTRLGEVYLKQGRGADAYGRFQAALQLDPDHELAKGLVATARECAAQASGATC